MIPVTVEISVKDTNFTPDIRRQDEGRGWSSPLLLSVCLRVTIRSVFELKVLLSPLMSRAA